MDSLSSCKNAMAWVKNRSTLIYLTLSTKTVNDAIEYYNLTKSKTNAVQLKAPIIKSISKPLGRQFPLTKKNIAIEPIKNDMHNSNTRRKLRSNGI